MQGNNESSAVRTILETMSAIIRNVVSKIIEISEEIIRLITDFVKTYREEHNVNLRETGHVIVSLAIAFGIVPPEYGEEAMDIVDAILKAMAC